MGGISATLSELVGTEGEEESDPGEVADGNVSWGGSLRDSVQGLDEVNREGTHSCWRIIFFMTEHQLLYHTKVEFSHGDVVRAISPHGCKYLTNVAYVLLSRLLLDGITLYRQKSGIDDLRKKLEERNGVFNASEVGTICSQLQKRRHCRQAAASFLNLVKEYLLEISCCAAL